MEFVTIRDLRLKPGDVWDKLRQQREIVLTSNGRPVAVMAGVGEDDVEETVAALRRARAQAAVSRMRRVATERGVDRMTAESIDAEIAEVRRTRGQGVEE